MILQRITTQSTTSPATSPCTDSLAAIAEFQRTSAFFSSPELRRFALGGPAPELPLGGRVAVAEQALARAQGQREGHQHQPVADPRAQPPQHLERPRLERPTRQPAGAERRKALNLMAMSTGAALCSAARSARAPATRAASLCSK